MENVSKTNKFSRADGLNLACLVVYLGCVLFFSSLFYLATEDYEAINAIRLIREGIPIGKSTGWPYTPLSGYFFYIVSLFVDSSILNLRIFTALFMLASVFPIYFIIRRISGPFLSLALTLFSFSLTTFPHPRLEYYIEGSLIAFSIFFGARYLEEKTRRHLYASAAFLVVAFGSKGYPNSALLLFLMPLSLVAAPWIVTKKMAVLSYLRLGRLVLKGWFRRFQVPLLQSIVGVLLALACAGVLMTFLKNTVYHRSFIEYVDVNDLKAFPNKGLVSSVNWLLLFVFVAAFVPPFLKWPKFGRSEYHKRIFSTFLPFFLFLSCGCLVAALAGYRFDDLLFFLFPADILLDHADQIATRNSTTISLFVIILVSISYLLLRDSIRPQLAEVGFFLLLIFMCTFVRFFPGYNMLYLGSFLVALVVSLIVPAVSRLISKTAFVIQLQRSVAIFLIVYSIGSNLFLLVITQWSDLHKGRLIGMTAGSVGGLFVENDIVRFFESVHTTIDSVEAKGSSYAFLSNSYLKYVPLVYGYRDALAGQNLTTGLGRLWSYDDLFKVNAEKSEKSNWSESVHYWRETAVRKMKEAKTEIIIMSLYDKKLVRPTLKPSADPLRQYLYQEFILDRVIEPNMQRHRRSSFSEGAVIFVKANGNSIKAQAEERPDENY